MLSASVSTASSSGGLIDLPPVPVISVLALRHAHDQPVERLADLELAGEAGVGLGERGGAHHAGFLRAGGRRGGNAQPPPPRINKARGPAALPPPTPPSAPR